MEEKKAKLKIGGQAVIEGVMIKSENYYTVSARKGKNIISMHEKLRKRKKFYSAPIIRGFFNLVDMMKIGMKSLMWSAEQAGDDDSKLTKKDLAITISISVAAVIIFFIMVPYVSTSLLGFKEDKSPFLFNLVDGIIRIIIFLIYLASISRMKDIQVLFQYHGAEHMAIHCYEDNLELTKSNVKKYRTMHPRCGTSFLLLVFAISILVFAVVPSIVGYFYPSYETLGAFYRKSLLFASRLLLIPFIAGISYEILKISDKRQNNYFFRMLSKPGIMLQKITTRKPTEAQIEVAIHSVKK